MNASRIVYCLFDIMKINLNDCKRDKALQEEREVAQYLADMINSLCDRKQFEYNEETTLDFYYDEHSSDDGETEEEERDKIENDSDYEPEDDVDQEHHTLSNYSIEFMQQVVDFAYGKDESRKCRRTWKSIHHRFRTLPHQSYVSRFKKYLEQHGTRRQKTQQIDKFVYEKLVNAREQFLPIHDIDLQRWAIGIARELDFNEFQASEFWVRSFKGRHKICSRKITNIITKREILNSSEILKSEKDFIRLFNKLSPKYNELQIFNTDQMGVEKEQFSTRTLSFQGEKKTFGVVKSKHATTHSYTIQPIISLGGQLVGPLYLCLQEPDGKMGATVKKRLFEPSNVVITCSKSGKLTSSLVRYWCEKCLIPSIDKRCLLLSDSYSGQNDPKIYEDIKSKSVERIMIPKNTTCDIQPLDRYFNRQLKILIKRVYHYVALEEIDINLWERNNIIKLMSLVHNQLASPVFKKMIQYSWFSSGYTNDDPSPFQNVLQVCFPQDALVAQCEERNCIATTFITCAICSKKLCFDHFFIEYHFHKKI